MENKNLQKEKKLTVIYQFRESFDDYVVTWSCKFAWLFLIKITCFVIRK